MPAAVILPLSLLEVKKYSVHLTQRIHVQKGPVILYGLVPTEYIPSIDLLLDVVEATDVSISNDCLGHLLKFLQVVNNDTPKEGAAIFQCELVDLALLTSQAVTEGQAE